MLFIPLAAYSGTEPKNFNLGIGYYSLQVYNTYSDETYSHDSERLNGISLSAAYMFSDNVALRGTYYSLSQSNFFNTDTDGYEVLVYAGRGMAMRGFKWYLGGGYFSEQWDSEAESNSFSGLQLGGGFGYNWERYAFDLLLHLRDPGDYDEHLSVPGIEIKTAGVLSLMLSRRF